MKRQEKITEGIDRRWKKYSGTYTYRGFIATRDRRESQTKWVVKERFNHSWDAADLSGEFETLQECLLEIDRMIDEPQPQLPTYAEVQDGPSMSKREFVDQIAASQGLTGEIDCSVPQGFLNELTEFAIDQRWCLNLFRGRDQVYHALRTFIAYHYPSDCGGFGEPVALCREVDFLLTFYNQMQDEIFAN